MSKAEFDKVSAILEVSRDLVIDIQKKITPAIALSPASGGTGESEKAAIVMDELKKMGVSDMKVIEAPDDRIEGKGRPNIIAVIPGKDTSKSLWIMSHLDVVPIGDEKNWNTKPWEATVEGDKIYGRGTEDNGQGIAVSMILAGAVMEAGVTPGINLKLLFIADEEMGSEYGIQHVIKKDNPFNPDDMVIVPDGGMPDGSMIEVAEKSILWTQFRVEGKQTHASTPERGINAHLAGAHLIVKLHKLHEDFPGKNDVFDPPGSTFEPTKKEANVPNINTIPGEDVFCLDARILPSCKLADVKGRIRQYAAEIEKQFNVKVEMEFPQDVEAAPPTSVDSPVVKALERATKEVYGVDAKPMGIGGGTVAAYLRKAGIPAAVWATMDETMHGPNEYVKISNIIGDARVIAHVLFAQEPQHP
ncbi:MAG: M20 family metallo-hydrolase [Pseudomonadota bacterium]